MAGRILERGAPRILAVLLLVLIGVAGIVLQRTADRPWPAATVAQVNQDGSYQVGSMPDGAAHDAVAAAVATVPAALSYDYRSLDQNLATATDGMTTAFGTTFADTFDATTRRMAGEKKAVTSALVRGAGIVGSPQGGRATVMVYVDQVLVSSTARSSADPLKVSQTRVRVDLRLVGGRWLVDGLQPF